MENQDATEIFHTQGSIEYNRVDLENVKEKDEEEVEEEKELNIVLNTDDTFSDICQDPGCMESITKEIELTKEKEDTVDSRICEKLKEVTTKVISSRPVLENVTERDNQAFGIIINKCLSMYNQEMQANIMKQVFYFDDILEKLHHKSYANALKCFKETFLQQHKNDLVTYYKDELINLMEESFKRISCHNAGSRERLCENAQAQALEKYKSIMEKSLLDDETENEYVQHSKFVKYSKFAEHEARRSLLDYCGLSDLSNEVENCESLGFKEEMKKLRMSILKEMNKYENLRRLKKLQVEKQMDQKVEIYVKMYRDEFEKKLKASKNVTPLTKDEFKQIHASLEESVLNDFKRETLTSILGSKYAEKLAEKLANQYKQMKKISFKGHDDMIINQTKLKLCCNIEKIESILNDSKALLDSSTVSCVTLEMHILKLEKALKLLES